MATRFRLPASGTAPASPAFQSYTHAPSSRVPLVTTDSTALATLALAPDAADHTIVGDTGFRQFVSAPLQAQTFSSGASFSYSVQALEAHANNNLQVQVWIGIVSNDGGTARGTIRSKILEGNEVNTALRNVNYSGTLDASVTCEDGDRLVVEFSLANAAGVPPVAAGGVQGHNGSLRFGSNGAGGDLPANDTETGTTFNPWIEFTTDVVFIKGLRRMVTTQIISASDVATTTYTITCTDPTTGDTFAPVAVLAHWSGRATVGTGEASALWGHGMATGAAARRCASWQAVHAAATTDNNGANRNDAFVVEISDAAAVTGLLDIDAFLGDGFRLIVDDQFAADLVIVIEAFGGDITAGIATITAPAATGDQDINVGLDLTGGLDDKAVIFFGPGGQTATINNAAISSNHGDIGVAAGDTPSQWATCWRNGAGGATTDTLRYMRAGECIASVTSSGGPQMRASVTTWLSTGFRLNWAETSNAHLFFALAIKGQRWYAGNELTRIDTTPEQIVAKYKPLFFLAASHGTTESASDTLQDGLEQSVGVAASSSSRACVAYVDPDNLADSDIAIGTFTDRIYQNFDETNADKSTTSGIMDISSFDNNGVTFVMDDADPSAVFFGYLIGADSRYAAVTMPAIAATTVLNAPTVVPGAVTVVGGTIASGNARFAPTVTQPPASQSVTAGTIASGNQRFAPTVALATQEVTGAHIASGNQRFAPIVSIHISNLVDAFPGPSVDTDLWDVQVFQATASIVSGRLRFASDTGRSSGVAVATAETWRAYNLTGGSVIVQVFPNAQDAVGECSTSVSLDSLSDPFENYSVTAYLDNGSVGDLISFGHNFDFQDEGYVAATDRWVRFRHDVPTNRVHIETSPDGINWTSRRDVEPVGQITDMTVTLAAFWAENDMVSETPAEFDNVNVPPQPITGGTIASGAALFAPTVALVQPVTNGTIASGSALFAPTLTVGAVTVVGAFIASGNQRYPPSVAHAVTVGTIASGHALFAPTVVAEQAVTTGTVAATTALFPPVITTQGTIAGAHIASTLVLYAPTVIIEYAVTTGTRASTVALFAPTVSPDQNVTTGTRTSTLVMFAPLVVPEQAVTTGTRASALQMFAPTVSPDQAVTGAFIASGSVLYAPSVARRITTGTIGSTAQTFAPTLAYGVALPVIAGTVLYPPTVIDDKLVLLAFIPSGTQLFGPAVFVGVFADVLNVEVYLSPALGMNLSTSRAVGMDVSVRRVPEMNVSTRRPLGLDVAARRAAELNVSTSPTES